MNTTELNKPSEAEKEAIWRQLADQGFSLIPLYGKNPIEKEWQQWCTVRKTFEMPQAGQNMGITCGPASGVLVLDIDNADKFVAWKERNAIPTLPPTRQHETGSGGTHYLYSYPSDGNEYRNRSFKPDGFDIRGNGGQVVAPGSIHPETGDPYKIANDLPIADAPEWLLKLALHEESQEEKTEGHNMVINRDFDFIPMKTEIRNLIQAGTDKGQRSEAIGKVLFALVWANCTDTEIFNIFDTYPIGEKYKEKGTSKTRWLQGEIDRARLKVTGRANHDESNDQEAAKFAAKIKELAALSPWKYDRVRKVEAETLNIRQTTLDDLVKAARSGEPDNSDLPFIEVVPWSESVDPAKLLTEISLLVRRFIVCTVEVSQAVALWIAMTWFIDVVQVAPLAVITAPEKRCGKTILLSLLEKLVKRAITVSNISSSALYRAIDAWCPTLLIDEADAFMKENEELRGILNSGHTRASAYVIRCVGDNQTPTKFNTWGAKALSGIGHLADTLMDRAIIMELRRKLPHEAVDRIRYADSGLFSDLRSQLARFADDYSEKVRNARPPLPPSLNDRAQDNWEPLLAIAMVVSDEWFEIGTKAALKLSGGESALQTIGIELLADIKGIFDEKQIDRISTSELINALCSDDEKPWATYYKGKAISPKQLATKLKGYMIKSKPVRIGNSVIKGYELEQFNDAFQRYVAPENVSPTPSPDSIGYRLQSAPVLDLRVTDENNVSVTSPLDLPIGYKSQGVTNTNVTGTQLLKSYTKPAPALNCNRVTGGIPPLTAEKNCSGHQISEKPIFKINDPVEVIR